MKKILALLTACILCFSLAYSPQSIDVNVWHKVSTDELNPGEIVPLDMSEGYSFCRESALFIVVHAIGSEEDIVIVFPNGGYWTSPEPDPFLQELQKEFDSLEDYLKENKGQEIKRR